MTSDPTQPPEVVVEPFDGGTFDVYARLREETETQGWGVSVLAEYLGVIPRTLRAQAAAGHIPAPDTRARLGGLSLQLYTLEAAVRVQEYYLKTGRPVQRLLDPDRRLDQQQW
jgi:hypothetical protein